MPGSLLLRIMPHFETWTFVQTEYKGSELLMAIYYLKKRIGAREIERRHQNILSP